MGRLSKGHLGKDLTTLYMSYTCVQDVKLTMLHRLSTAPSVAYQPEADRSSKSQCAVKGQYARTLHDTSVLKVPSES